MKKPTGFLLAGLFVTLLLAGVVSNFASSAPDGLDATVERGCTRDAAGVITGGTCIAQGAEEHEAAASPFADYATAGVDQPHLSTGLSGVLGVLLTLALAGGLFWLTRTRGGAAGHVAADHDAAGHVAADHDAAGRDAAGRGAAQSVGAE
ncbi:MAG TPA: PDGLE domain-containing protein [Actinoplanes sp.]|nr:PDGLE domain-containing protein [Actinoplanes sp.]